MRERLLVQAMELAEKCRKYGSNIFRNKARPAKSLRAMESDFMHFVQYSWHLVGFCEALIETGVFSEDDIKKIFSYAFPEFDFPPEEKGGLPKTIKEFIKGLKQLDDLGSEG